MMDTGSSLASSQAMVPALATTMADYGMEQKKVSLSVSREWVTRVEGFHGYLLIVLNDARQSVLDFSYLTIAQGDDQIGLLEDLGVVRHRDQAPLVAVAA